MVPYVLEISLVDVFLVFRCSSVTNTCGFTLSLSISPILVFFLPVLLPISSFLAVSLVVPSGLWHFTCRPRKLHSVIDSTSGSGVDNSQFCQRTVSQPANKKPTYMVRRNTNEHARTTYRVWTKLVVSISLRVFDFLGRVDFTSSVCKVLRMFHFTCPYILVIRYYSYFNSIHFQCINCALPSSIIHWGSFWNRIGIG